jgi:protein O-mannosyl-transferase
MSISFKDILFVFLIGVIAFIPSLHGDFLWDDELLITHNPAVKSLHNLPSAFTKEFFAGSYENPQITFYRPVITSINIFQYALFGLRPLWWHLFNLLMHGFNAVLFLIVMRRLLNIGKRGALLGALFFAVHPVISETVCFISGRTDIMALFFILGALLCFFKETDNKKLYRIFSLVLFTFGLFSKELVLMFPALILAFDYYRSEEKSGSEYIKKRLPNLLFQLLPFFITGTLFVIIRFFLVKGIRVSGFPSGNVITTWLTMPKIFFVYIYKSVFPINLLCDYTNYFKVEKSIFSSSFIIPAFFLLCLIIATVVAFIKKKKIFIAPFVFLLFLFPVMNIFPLGLWMAERFLYIPLIGPAISLAMGIDFFNLPRKRKQFSRALLITSIVIVLIFTGMSLSRAMIWRDGLSLWEDAVKKSPENPQARIILAQLLFSRKKNEEAIKHLDAAKEDPGTSLFIVKYQTYTKIYTQEKNDLTKALESLEKLEKYYPDSSYNFLLKGKIFFEQGKINKAKKAFRESLIRNPFQTGAIVKLMEINVKSGGSEEDLFELSGRAISINPDYSLAYVYRGMALRKMNRMEDAVKNFREAINRAPQSPDAYLFLADLYESQIGKETGALNRARVLYEEILEYHPDHTDALNNLAILYARSGKLKKAEKLWKRVIEIKPSDESAKENIRRLEKNIK